MIEMKDFFEVIDYKIESGSKFLWSCYGNNAHIISSTELKEYDASMIFDTVNQTVYEVTVSDYTTKKTYRLFNPDFREAYYAEAKERNIDPDKAWDTVRFINLELDKDWLDKAKAIVNNQEYDERVEIELTFKNKNELHTLMLAAHQADMTLNEYISSVIKQLTDE